MMKSLSTLFATNIASEFWDKDATLAEPIKNALAQTNTSVLEKACLQASLSPSPLTAGLELALTAAKLGYSQSLNYIVNQCRLDPNTQGNIGVSLLHVATHYGQYNIVRYLWEKHRVDVNARSQRDQEHPLHIAVQGQHLSIIEYLVEQCQVDANQPISTGMITQSALELAYRHGYADAVYYFTVRASKVISLPAEKVVNRNGCEPCYEIVANLGKYRLAYKLASGHTLVPEDVEGVSSVSVQNNSLDPLGETKPNNISTLTSIITNQNPPHLSTIEGKCITPSIMGSVFGIANPRNLTIEQPYQVLAGIENLSHHPEMKEVYTAKESLKTKRHSIENAVANLLGYESGTYLATQIVEKILSYLPNTKAIDTASLTLQKNLKKNEERRHKKCRRITQTLLKKVEESNEKPSQQPQSAIKQNVLEIDNKGPNLSSTYK